MSMYRLGVLTFEWQRVLYLHSVNTYPRKVNYHFLCSTSKVDQHLEREEWGEQRDKAREHGTFSCFEKRFRTKNVNTLLLVERNIERKKH